MVAESFRWWAGRSIHGRERPQLLHAISHVRRASTGAGGAPEPFRQKLIDRLCQLIADQQAGKKVEVPAAGEQVWYWFRELDCQRTGNGYGMNALGFREIKAWSDLREISLLPWQVDAILALDIKRRTISAESSDDKPKEEEVSSRPLSPQLFDAIFPNRIAK